MGALYINLILNNNTDESFSINKGNVINDNIFSMQDLSKSDNEVYQKFIKLMGHNHVILIDVNIDSELIVFNRLRLFDHDDSYNMLNIGSYMKSYNDYDSNEKIIIDSFLNFINGY